MPEFLINSNAYHFGVKQDGEPLGDVVLPRWAKVFYMSLQIWNGLHSLHVHLNLTVTKT